MWRERGTIGRRGRGLGSGLPIAGAPVPGPHGRHSKPVDHLLFTTILFQRFRAARRLWVGWEGSVWIPRPGSPKWSPAGSGVEGGPLPPDRRRRPHYLSTVQDLALRLFFFLYGLPSRTPHPMEDLSDL